MGTNHYPDHTVLPFKRKHMCVFCSIFSIPLRPGIYSSDSQKQRISLTSNNPNEILKEIQRNSPSPLVKAMDTSGLTLDEAIAWRKVTKEEVETVLDEMQGEGYEQLLVPQSVGNLLTGQGNKMTVPKIIIEPSSWLNPNSRFSGLLIRLITVLKFLVGYSIPLILPFAIFKQEFVLPVLVLFGTSLLLAALIWPVLEIRSWIKGVFLALIMGLAYTAIGFFVFPQSYQTGLSVTAVILGVLVGVLLGCTDRVSTDQDRY